MSGLAALQAVATLQGARLGVLNGPTVHAALVVIVVSLVIAPALAALHRRQAARAAHQMPAVGRIVLVPVWSESARPLLDLAARVAASDGGAVVAASFADERAPAREREAQRGLGRRAQAWLAREGFASRAVFRACRHLPDGVRGTARAERATLLIIEWPADADTDVARELDRAPAPAPILGVRGRPQPFDRLIVVARHEDPAGAGRRDRALAAVIGARLAAGRRMVTVGADASLFAPAPPTDHVAAADPIGWLAQNLRPSDLPLFAGAGAARDFARRCPALAGGRLLVAIAPPPPARDAPPSGPASVAPGLRLYPV
jgi:hypothetical protein